MLLNFEHTISRAKKALMRVRKNDGDHRMELALIDAIAYLKRAHKRLLQATCSAAMTTTRCGRVETGATSSVTATVRN